MIAVLFRKIGLLDDGMSGIAQRRSRQTSGIHNGELAAIPITMYERVGFASIVPSSL
jgi:hypothetical protein